MKNKKLLLLLVSLWMILPALAQKKTAKVNWKKVSVLVYTRNGEGYVHKNIDTASMALRQLGEQHGFAVTVSDNPADFNEANLKKYTLVIFNNTNNNVFDTDEQRVAFMRYVQAGGGFIGIHSATGTERNWPWFKRLVGGTFVRHANYQAFKEIVIDHDHPSTAFLPRIWERSDECYYVKEMNPDIRVLIVHDLASVDDKDKPEFFGISFPSVWCHNFDGGAQWYTSLGHDAKTYLTEEFKKHLLGGIQWVVSESKGLDYSKARAQSPGDPLPY